MENEIRAKRAEKTLLAYLRTCDDAGESDSLENTITDLMTDLAHYADEEGIRPEDLIATALNHYKQERKD